MGRLFRNVYVSVVSVLLAAAIALMVAACAGGGSSGTIAGLPADEVLQRSDGTEVTVEEQWNHLRALIDDMGYGTICGTLLTPEPGEPEGGQTQEDVENLHKLHKAACDEVRDSS